MNMGSETQDQDLLRPAIIHSAARRDLIPASSEVSASISDSTAKPDPSLHV